MKTQYQISLVPATSESPCPHCGKPDWCYLYGDLSVCNRDIEPAPGWYKTSKTDEDGHYYYAPDRPKAIAKKQTRKWEYKKLDGTPVVQVVRIDKGDASKPIRFQNSWDGKKWVKGTKGIDRSEIPIYRYAEVREAINDNRPIFIVEGEKCSDALWNIGLAATTNIGGSGKWRESDTECLAGATEIVICPDRDKAGIKHANQISEQFPNALWLYAPPSQFSWLSDNIPQSQGIDVADWIADGANEESVKAQITNLDPDKFSASLPLHTKPKPEEQAIKNREVIVEAEEIFTQKALDCLYSDTAYLTVHDSIYKYNGTHYEKCSTARERRRITEWCNTTPIEVNGRWKYALAKPETVNKIWNWVLSSFAVDSEDINPAGINCLNGVLQIAWRGRKVSYELIPHTPDFYFTHVANFNYDPQADDRDCNRLLAALDTEQQKIFLRTIAASLDLPTVRKYQGRTVKALLCTGTGSNGKDTLREAVKSILGASMSSASVSDFQQYDQGRKFPAAKIEHAKINWSSENSEFARIDSLQGLKAAITGEDFDIEPKNAIEYSVTPRTVFLFNCNAAPLLQGGAEAIKSRWSVLSFNKTFKTNANVALGELQADSRFRYDPEFLDECVCPALLNKILEQLQTVVLEGIDYSCCDRDLTKVQEQSNHLWGFINDLGIQRSPGSRLYISDLWRSLEKWYVDNGTLEYDQIGDRFKKIWHDQARSSDKNITASNQVAKRFIELFPDCEKRRHTESDGSDRKGKFYILGLNLSGEATVKHEIQSYQRGEDGEAKIATLAQLVDDIKLLPSPERLTAINIMKKHIESEADLLDFASPSSPQDYVRDSASPLASPEEEQRSLERSPTGNTQNNSNFSDRTTESTLNITINNAASSPHYASNSSSVNHLHTSGKPIDWIRDKAGEIWQVDDQSEECITGHRSGLRGFTDIRYEDVAEFHYKKEEAEVEANK